MYAGGESHLHGLAPVGVEVHFHALPACTAPAQRVDGAGAYDLPAGAVVDLDGERVDVPVLVGDVVGEEGDGRGGGGVEGDLAGVDTCRVELVDSLVHQESVVAVRGMGVGECGGAGQQPLGAGADEAVDAEVVGDGAAGARLAVGIGVGGADAEGPGAFAGGAAPLADGVDGVGQELLVGAGGDGLVGVGALLQALGHYHVARGLELGHGVGHQVGVHGVAVAVDGRGGPAQGDGAGVGSALGEAQVAHVGGGVDAQEGGCLEGLPGAEGVAGGDGVAAHSRLVGGVGEGEAGAGPHVGEGGDGASLALHRHGADGGERGAVDGLFGSVECESGGGVAVGVGGDGEGGGLGGSLHAHGAVDGYVVDVQAE